jgi:hypothetical protein
MSWTGFTKASHSAGERSTIASHRVCARIFTAYRIESGRCAMRAGDFERNGKLCKRPLDWVLK